MVFSPRVFDGARDRHTRFEPLFASQDFVHGRMEEVFDRYGDRVRVRKGKERNLSLVVALSIAKGFKTFSAVTRLCLLGYGEDATVLVRSNANLLINVAYILKDSNPEDCADRFLAYSYRERERYLREASNTAMPVPPPVPPEKVAEYAEDWARVNIRQRAHQAGIEDFHYGKLYKLFSSMEHSDAFALNTYIAEWNEVGPRLEGESDKDVELALLGNFLIASDLLLQALHYYQINRPDMVNALQSKWTELATWEQKSQNEG